MRRMRWFILLSAVAVYPQIVRAHETDQYSVPTGREFADLGAYFGGALHEALDQTVTTLNTQIRESLRHGEPTTATDRFHRPRVVAETCYHAIPLWFDWVDMIEHRLLLPAQRNRFPGLVTVHQPTSWIYDHWALVIDPTKLPRQVHCGTVMVNGVYFGTDKLMHFCHVGFQYYETYCRALANGKAEADATRDAIDVGSHDNPFYSEGTWLGLLTTGVWSNADLVANYNGFLFFRNLTEPVDVGGQTRPPMLVRDGLYWRVADDVAANPTLFSRFVTDHWDEVLNPCWYPTLIGKCVRESIASRCSDTIAWYRTRHPELRTPQDFLAEVARMQTYQGVDYGARGTPDELASIATVCDDQDWDIQGLEVAASPASVEIDMTEVATTQPDRDAFSRGELWWAADVGDSDRVKAALAHGADPNQPDIDGETPLHAAARRGTSDIIDLLCAAGADVNRTARYGVTPLHLAVRANRSEVAAALLRHGAEPLVADAFGMCPLDDAKAQNDSRMLALFAPATSAAPSKTPSIAVNPVGEMTVEYPESLAQAGHGSASSASTARSDASMPVTATTASVKFGSNGSAVKTITMEPCDWEQP